jgi:hypothetical protein
VTRAFNGLNGAEIRKRLVQELDAQLAQDTRLGAHLVFPVVTWTWKLELSVEPSPGTVDAKTDGVLRSEVRGRVSGEGRTGPAIGPAFQGPVASPVGERVAPAPVETTLEARFARLESLIAQVVEGQTVKVGSAPVPSTTVGELQATITEGNHPDIQMRTGTGLPITGGALPSPGPGLAASFGSGSSIGSVQPATVPEAAPVETLQYGVVHATLADGGIGPPDAVRREAGLPVPQMQTSAGGGIVDLPAGTF